MLPTPAPGTRSVPQARIPWNDAAVLVLLGASGHREIVAEGTLRQMMTRIAAKPIAEWHRFSISLPDRQAPPFAFDRQDFGGLIVDMAR